MSGDDQFFLRSSLIRNSVLGDFLFLQALFSSDLLMAVILNRVQQST